MILLTLVISLGFVCGFIAYVGDYLGKRLGKKRVSLFGLRPRQTAVLISVTTGVCIFLVAFTGILAASQNARHALLRFAETVRRNRELTAANDGLKRANQQLEKSRHELEEKTSRLQTQVKSIEEELLAKRKELNETTQTLKQTEQMLKTVEKEYNEIRRKYTAVQSNLKEIQAKLQDARTKLVAMNKELARTRTSAENIGKDYVNLGKKFVELEKQVVDLEKQRDMLIAEIKKLTEEVQQLSEWRTYGMKVVRGRVTIGVNDVIASRTIPEGLTPEAVRKELEQLLKETSRVAEEHGAKASEEQPRPLILATREIIAGDVRGFIHEDQILDNTADDIVKRKKSFVVDVIAWRNYVEGEPVQAQLALYPNQMVYSKGDNILSKEVRGSQSKAGLFHDINELLEEAQLVAAQQGVMPRKKYAYEEGTNEKIFDLLERLASQRGRAQVRVIAAKNLWTADQLSVRFEVSQ
jgi:uncharacterized protein (DUF3084 family)